MRSFFYSGLLTFALCFLLSPNTFSQSVVGDLGTDDSTAAEQPNVQELIEGLADPRYSVRHRSQRLLEQRGLEAFDSILNAQDNVDPEVSVACKRLLTSITEPWSIEGAPIEVNVHLWDYGNSSSQARQDSIDEINDLANGLGIKALCRLARFEPSETNSQYAAMSLLKETRSDGIGRFASESRLKEITSHLAVLEQLYGPTKRIAFNWLKKAAVENVGAEYWMKQAALQPHHYDQGDWTSRDSMLWLALYRAHQQRDEKLLKQAFQLLVDETPESLTFYLQELTEQLVEVDAWPTIDSFLEKYQISLNDRPGLYLQAHLANSRGDLDQAEQLAKQAFQLPALATPSNKDWFTQQPGYSWTGAQLLGDRILMANTLDVWLHREWALRELEEVCKPLEPMSVSTIFARWKITELLHDSERPGEAAFLLREMLDHIQSTNERSNHFRQLIDNSEFGGIPSLEVMKGQLGLCEALARRQMGEEEKARSLLDKAFQADRGNADIVIAMYHSPGADEAYREKVRKRILQSCRNYEVQIASNPSNPIYYNHWAWVVSNTEGDFEKAIRYSKRSLDLVPDSAGYLDTLGRCYFSNGQIEEAIKAQQRAVELLPSTQTLQRQLQEFLDAQAEQAR